MNRLRSLAAGLLLPIPSSGSAASIVIAGKIPAPVPEPGTLLLLGTGLAALAGFRRKS